LLNYIWKPLRKHNVRMSWKSAINNITVDFQCHNPSQCRYFVWSSPSATSISHCRLFVYIYTLVLSVTAATRLTLRFAISKATWRDLNIYAVMKRRSYATRSCARHLRQLLTWQRRQSLKSAHNATDAKRHKDSTCFPFRASYNRWTVN